jgi:hypothetical protein
MDDPSEPFDPNSVTAPNAVFPGVVEDLYARGRAGVRDAELINLLAQPDRCGLDAKRARTLISELPQY